MFKKKENMESYERFKIKKKDYELMEKDFKKLLIDYDDDCPDSLKAFIPDLTNEQYSRIYIFAEEYELKVASVRDMLSNLQSRDEDDEE